MAEILINPEKSSHWYTKDGKPMHHVPMKTRPGEFRNTTVKDARELGLLPSVTSIQQVVYKPVLQSWIQTQLVLSALTLPMLPGESHDAFAKRVVQDGAAEGKAAADFGTRIHALVEMYLRDASSIPSLDAWEMGYLTGFIDWTYKNKLEPVKLEETFANEAEGFGGTIDYQGYLDEQRVIIDWKTQKTYPGKGISFYPDWNPQLAAYKHGKEDRESLLVSVVISSTEPGRVQSFVWPDDDQAWECFKAMRTIYYSPLGQGSSLRKGNW